MLVKLLFSLSSISPPETKKRTVSTQFLKLKDEILKQGTNSYVWRPIPALVKLLKFQTTSNIGELATAAILTLSAAPINKPAIAASEAVPILVQILSSGSIQGRVDAK
ncbi:hypothetical protein L1887_04065 [Cichorium endivia]|nr:hypothetical protein L1887_04065 [Cichorium endivia]